MRAAHPQSPPPPRHRRRTAALAFALTLWLASAVAGSVFLLRYQVRPGPAAAAAAPAWPADAPLPRDPARHTLVVALHPKCPCSRATVRELATLAAACGDRLRLNILLVRPDGAPDDWAHTPLAHAARALPSADVSTDPAGQLARRFGALTSGHAALYDPAGRLVFTGGMTASRGHAGDAPGPRAVLAAVLNQTAPPVPAAARVFGCPLSNDPQATCAERP